MRKREEASERYSYRLMYQRQAGARVRSSEQMWKPDAIIEGLNE